MGKTQRLQCTPGAGRPTVAGPEGKEISGDVMRAACDLARWFGNEAERIYALMAETPEQREQRKLIEFIHVVAGG